MNTEQALKLLIQQREAELIEAQMKAFPDSCIVTADFATRHWVTGGQDQLAVASVMLLAMSCPAKVFYHCNDVNGTFQSRGIRYGTEPDKYISVPML